MAKLNKTIVAIYIRVSTIRQAEEGFSLDAQTEHLTNYCKANGYTIFKIYADRGKSGKNTNRPELQQMLSDMREGKFKKILVMKLDRISRSVMDLENLINEMKACNCDFESATEKLDTDSAMGMMFIRLLGIFAAFERDRKSERVNETFAYMVDNGQPITGMQPLGYKVEEINGIKRVVKDEEQEEFINDIFSYFFNALSVRSTFLYAKEKHNYSHCFQSFTRIFKNEIYIGTYKDNTNYCEPYLTKEQYDIIQRHLDKTPKKTPTDRVYIFSGLVECGTCGCAMGGESRKKKRKMGDTYYKFYRCNNKRINKNCDNSHVIFESTLERYLLDNLIPEANKYLLELNVSSNGPKKVNVSSLYEELDRLNYIFQKNRISIDDYDRQYEEIENKIKAAESSAPITDTSYLLELKELDLEAYYHKLNDESKRSFWRKYISKIVYNEDKTINIFFN